MLLLSPTILLPSLLLLLALLLTTRLRSPLARLPGPWHTRLTSLVLKWHELRAQRTRYVHALHRRHGPVVRLGPHEASFASAAAVKEIYCAGGSGYDKTEFYDLFTVYGRRTMFSTRGRAAHARRKRMLADRYANSNVVKGESLRGVEERSARFVGRVRRGATTRRRSRGDGDGDGDNNSNSNSNDSSSSMMEKETQTQTGTEVDIYTALHAYAFDCASHHLFHPFGADSLRRADDERIMLEVTGDSSLQNRLVRYWSPLAHRLVGPLLALVAPPRDTPLADRFVLEASARGREARPFTLLSRLSGGKGNAGDGGEGGDGGGDGGEGGGGGLEPLTVAAECLDHMAAGIDTTGDALCFLMWELSQPRSARFQEKLREELARAAAAKDGGEEKNTSWDKLPYLDAVVREGLRCFPAIPMSLPRYVPAGGRTIDGYFLPGHTIVSCQAYSVHRVDETVFPEPDRFDPERWLVDADADADDDEDDDDARRRRRGENKRRSSLFFAFAAGGRGCVGKHLALAEMKILLRDVYGSYRTVPGGGMREEEMGMEDQLISSRPRGQRCLMRFLADGE